MKSFVGIGKGSTSDVLRNATKGIGNPKGIIFICGYEQLNVMTEQLGNMFPDCQIMGTSGSSIANGTVGDNQLVIIGFYEDAEISFDVLENISVCPIVQIKKLDSSLSKVGASKENTVCYEFCTGAEEKLVVTLQSVLSKKNIPLVGGTVFGVPVGKPSLVACNGKLYTDACVYAVIRNTTGKVRVYKENIYQKPADSLGHYATKVDTSNRAICELDGRKATDLYSNETGVTRDQIVGNVFKNPFGRAVGDELYIASMRDLGSDGSIALYKRINKNDYVYILELSDYDETERKTRELIKNESHKISLILSVDCAYRYILYNQEKYLGTFAQNMAGLGNHISLIGGGEQYMNQHVNQTMVCAVFE